MPGARGALSAKFPNWVIPQMALRAKFLRPDKNRSGWVDSDRGHYTVILHCALVYLLLGSCNLTPRLYFSSRTSVET